MMKNTGQEELAIEYKLEPFAVQVLEPSRTLCEKIMSLVRFSFSENAMENLKAKIRHIYDLHLLLRDKNQLDFFISPAFDEMILTVAKDDAISFKNNNKWLNNHPSAAVLFKEPQAVWHNLVQVYEGDFSLLVFGELPPEKEILNTLFKIATRLKTIQWGLKIG